MENQKYALLIDSDNISHKYISCILDEMTKYGVTTVSYTHLDVYKRQLYSTQYTWCLPLPRPSSKPGMLCTNLENWEYP